MSRENQRQVAALLGLIPADDRDHVQDDTVQDDTAPDFDGGAREPAPGPSDPVSDHDELVSALLSAASLEQRGGEW